MATDAERALAAKVAAQDGFFTIADARAVGLSEARIRHRAQHVWHRIYDGVFQMPGAPDTWRGRLRAACWAGGSGAFVSHRAAAVFYELPGRRDDQLEITCPRWTRTVESGLIVHESRRTRAQDITAIDGIKIATPELTVLQLASWQSSPNYVEAVIHAARRKRLISYDSMHATFVRHARRGLKGVSATRIALERWNPANAASQSEMETLLFQTMRANGLPELVLQFEVLDPNGIFVARTDAALPGWKITIEYQSMQEHLDEFQVAADDRRRNRILAAGYFPLVARIEDLRSGGHELAEQIRAVARRSA